MAATKRIDSIAQVRTLDDRILTDCYVVGIGYVGLTALSERPIPAATPVFVDLAYVNQAGELEGETLRARVDRCDRHTAGSHLLQVRFLQDLRAHPAARLTRYVERQIALRRPAGPERPGRAPGGGSA